MNRRIENGSPQTDTAVRLGQVIASLSHRLDPKRSGSAAMAQLRRISQDNLPSQFWLVYLSEVPLEWREPNGRPDVRHDRSWASLIRAMAEMGPRPHSLNRQFGRALADTGYSEDRFVRLVRASDSTLERELRTASVWLARSGVLRVNWIQPAELFSWGPGRKSRSSTVRHRLAREYFSSVARRSP
ncbi:MAG: type I-E CRISPR-associated protein Cse2/CasB [Bryobacterales bacterium]|nr:type I-E CRISPR-associated protein Cse2/CasB [Bryobacterales bacterium]